MISTTGKIQSVHTDYVVFEYSPKSACNSCQLKAGCGQGMLSRWGQSINTIAVSSEHPALQGIESGASAQLEIADNALAISALISYLLPIITLLIGALMMSFVSSKEWLVIVGAGLGLGAGGFGVFVYNIYQRHNPWYQPRLATGSAARENHYQES